MLILVGCFTISAQNIKLSLVAKILEYESALGEFSGWIRHWIVVLPHLHGNLIS
jgi:hypothetical protein